MSNQISKTAVYHRVSVIEKQVLQLKTDFTQLLVKITLENLTIHTATRAQKREIE